ncbi:uncharacterized protein LOC101119459 isoform X1 [Ovis aries]|uniref:uncharacterized protein LOC101119459 isoform X1 n=2 Tax=Ovis aries TaxID=9940 RepID=UPI0029528389|nr:uncharacterized protein LOC101119459 isoform X1 [Ovis aries]XP_060268604.1 uncharacterized protein LOC101119459 isoform X1 [Ovis aries]
MKVATWNYDSRKLCLSSALGSTLKDWLKGSVQLMGLTLKRDLPNPGIDPGSPALQVDSLPAELPNSAWDNMPTAKQLADIGYKTFSTSMMLLTVYGGYLCSVRAYHYFQRRSSQRQAAEEQKTSGAL